MKTHIGLIVTCISIITLLHIITIHSVGTFHTVTVGLILGFIMVGGIPIIMDIMVTAITIGTVLIGIRHITVIVIGMVTTLVITLQTIMTIIVVAMYITMGADV